MAAIQDPSGIVYEGSMSMPVEGVTASLMINETDEGVGSLWNAGDYGQVNPQTTDANGAYAWDVPSGYFKVLFDKEGYEPAATEWMPVPPPQLDVNVSIRKTSPADLKTATAHTEDVFVEFDTFMDATTLTPDNIFVDSEGTLIPASIELVNAEIDGDNKIASKLKIVPQEPITSDEVTLHIATTAATYAGVTLSAEICKVLPIELAITELVSPEEFRLAYGETSVVRVHALPAKAVAGKVLKVVSGSSMIAGVDGSEYPFDENGYAGVEVTGMLPGNAALAFAVEGYDGTADTRVVVSNRRATEVATPQASIPSGSEVEPGTLLSLTCSTPEAVIYYTLDGSCPCDPASTREIFNDEKPIVLTTSVTVTAMAMLDGVESEIATFNYKVTGAGIDDVMTTGGVKIYPVPVKESLNVEMPFDGDVELTLIDTNGVDVLSTTVTGQCASVDVRELTPGFYILKLREVATGNIITRRIVKQ